MRLTRLATHLDTLHTVGVVLMLADEGGVNGAGEAGPSAARVELIRGDEERFARRDIDIDAFALLVPIVVVKGMLRSGMLRDSVLSGGEPTAQLFVRRLDIGIGIASDLEELGADMAVARWVLVQIVLVVCRCNRCLCGTDRPRRHLAY